MNTNFISSSVEETEQIGKKFAMFLQEQKNLKYYPFIALKGDLGAGKTAFVRGVASVISPGSRVKSPTFTIVNEYCQGNIPLYHFDLYKTGGGDELDSIGFEEYTQKGICIIEWSEYLDYLPEDSIVVKINKLDENSRELEMSFPSMYEGELK